MLSWLLSDNIKTKNQFVRNRLKDIKEMIEELKKNASLSVKLKYVPTDQNPADLLTRGVTFEKFQQSLRRWTLGPEWLSKNPIEWPSSELHCQSSKK